jgi:two-component system, chemotaxis family, chemotaxis protein CheY
VNTGIARTEVTEVTTNVQAPRVLIVDDSISTRALIGKTLEGAGYVVSQAADGVEALDTLSTAGFDVVITDQWMPNMTGVEFVRAVRENPDFADLPILAVTTDGEEDVRTEVTEAGASECILKPFSPDDLLETIARMTES